MTLLAISLAAFGCKKAKSGAGEAVAKMEGFQKAMCECKDKACADKVNEDMTKWGAEMAKNAGAAKDDKPDPELAKKSADIMTKYTECMTKLMMAGAGAGTGSADAGSGSAAAAGSGSDAGSAAAGSAAPAGGELMSKGGGQCPSMVLGAETKAELKGKDVIVTITAADKDAIAAIQKRAEELLKERADAPGGTVHDQKGSQGGAKGICPVFWEEGGKAESKKDAKGVIITITPKDKPDALKATIDGRITKSAEWVKANIKPGDAGNKGAVGGGGGDHGSDHSGSGDGKGKERKGDGKGGGAGTGGGGGAGTGGGSGGGSAKADAPKPAPAKAPVKAPAKPADKAAGGW